jgi:small multidrug resistance pump
MYYWMLLAVAILLEVTGTTFLKLSEGFHKIVPSVVMVLCYAGSLVLLTFVVRKLDLSLAYAIWAGIGTALIAVVGIWRFSEPVTLLKIVSIALIIIGVVGVNLSGTHR